MKSYLFSIKPGYCEYIAAGLKRDEIRKTAPKEVPFKGYIYCTLDGGMKGDRIRAFGCDTIVTCGKVIGEFVCNSVTDIVPDWNGFYTFTKGDEETSCLTMNKLHNYLQNHIGKDIEMSDVVIYDKPKELSEFGLKRAPQSWCHCEEIK